MTATLEQIKAAHQRAEDSTKGAGEWLADFAADAHEHRGILLAEVEQWKCNSRENKLIAEQHVRRTSDPTDDMCKRALDAMKIDRIQGFSTPVPGRQGEWGSPHYIRDVFLPHGQQELWRGDSHADMMERCAIEEMRLALRAALSHS